MIVERPRIVPVFRRVIGGSDPLPGTATSGRCPLVLVAIVFLLSFGSCRSKDEPPALLVPEPVDSQAALPESQASPSPLDRDREIEAAQQLLEQREFDAAAAKLKPLLVLDPGDVEVVFWLASVSAARGDLAAAVELLDSIPAQHPEAGIPALGQSADWCLQLERYGEAEQRYRKVLELFPEAPEAHRKLAILFNRQGRRHEAAAHIRQLCNQGNVRQDELHGLIHLSDAMYDDPADVRPSTAADRYVPIGPAAAARKLFQEEKYREALMRLHDSVAAGQQPPSIVAFYGRIAAEAQDDVRFRWWLARTDQRTQEFAEYWAAVGAFLALQNRPQQASAAILQAVDRDPTDLRSIGRLRSALESLGHREEAVRLEERWKLLRDIAIENNRVADSHPPDVDAIETLAGMLESVDRNLEGILWRSLAGH